MTQVIDASPAWMAFDRRRITRQIVLQNVLGVVAIGVSAVAGAWVLNVRLAKAPDFVEVRVDPTSRPLSQASIAPRVVASNPYGSLYDPGFANPSTSNQLARSLALASQLEAFPAPSLTGKPVPRPGDTAPLPPPRPPELAALEISPPLPVPRPADLPTGDLRPGDSRPAKAAAEPAAPADGRSFMQKLFGGLPTQSHDGPALAYASPDTTSITRDTRNNLAARAAPEAPRFSLFGGSPSPASITGRYDKYTAVYDLTAHVVYLPNGTKLEAHSGLGDRLDDPRFVSERGRGATPPHLYDLTPREQSFHGVQALRLTPVGGDGDIFGRAGLLAHSYMLGPNGDSNGCVSFKDYDAFLQAYQSGQVKRLAVVARLD